MLNYITLHSITLRIRTHFLCPFWCALSAASGSCGSISSSSSSSSINSNGRSSGSTSSSCSASALRFPSQENRCDIRHPTDVIMTTCCHANSDTFFVSELVRVWVHDLA